MYERDKKAHTSYEYVHAGWLQYNGTFSTITQECPF